MRLQDKVTLITGAGSGQGRAAAVEFGREGSKLGLSDVDGAGLERTLQLVKEAGGAAGGGGGSVARAGGGRERGGGGVIPLTRGMASTYGPEGVRVTAIAPGAIDTPMTQITRDLHPERRRANLERTPLRRIGLPEEVARLALFLASDESSFITGTVQ